MANTTAPKNIGASANNNPPTITPGLFAGGDALAQTPGRITDAYWHSLQYFNLYRLIVAGILLLAHLIFGARNTFGIYDPKLFVWASVLYLIFGSLALTAVRTRWPRFGLQVTIQVFADILLITVLMFTSGGISSGLGLLILVTLAASSLITQGRLAMFHAAVATIAALLQETYFSITHHESGEYLQAGLLSIAYFATAALAFALAKRLTATEEIAKRQRIDLANLDAVNRLVIQDMLDGVIVVDGDNRIRQINTHAERLLGPLQEKRRGLSLTEYFPQLAERIDGWRESGDIGMQPLRSSAENRAFRIRILPIGDKRALGAVVFLEDISRLQAQAHQLKLAALGRLTANIAHEIRNPLSSVGHATQLLQEDERLDGTQKRLLEIIRDNTFRLDRMVQDILQLNRKDRGQPESIPLVAYLRTFQQEFCQVEHIPEGVFVIEGDAGLQLLFDRYHFHQVLWNLCRNAWRHCQQKPGSIRLQTRRIPIGNVIQLDVIDDGPGVPIDIQPQLFEPFYTTESTGTGLGLYIARQFAEANDATLDYVESASGGVFRLTAKGAIT